MDFPLQIQETDWIVGLFFVMLWFLAAGKELQKDIFLMMNHINSYKRKKLNNRSPYETFSFYYGEDILKKLGCKPVAAENIVLKPKLLKK